MTRESWLEAHAYLRPVAELSAEVDCAADVIAIPQPPIPNWEDHRPDFLAGMTLLHSAAAMDLEPGGRAAAALIERLASVRSSGWLAAETRALHTELQREPHAGDRIVDLLLGDESAVPPFAGLTRYLGWTAMRRFLGPVVVAFNNWRHEENDEKWQRPYCPTCGSLPAMAQLAGEDPARRRLWGCGCGDTRWQFRRTGGPYCENDSQRLETMVVEGECGFRIDYCPSCSGYIKTYDGSVDENLFLSDWSSLHLDLLAIDRGLKRLATSLYELEPAPHQ